MRVLFSLQDKQCGKCDQNTDTPYLSAIFNCGFTRMSGIEVDRYPPFPPVLATEGEDLILTKIR